MRHHPYEERLQRLGFHSLQRRRLRAGLIATFKTFTGLLDIDPNLFFLTPTRCVLRGHPFKVLQAASHRRSRGLAFSVRIVTNWNKLPVSIVPAPSITCFQEKIGESLVRNLSPSPLLTKHSYPHFPTPPNPTCTPPINSYHLYMLPNSLFYICGFLRPVVAFLLPLQIIIMIMLDLEYTFLQHGKLRYDSAYVARPFRVVSINWIDLVIRTLA